MSIWIKMDSKNDLTDELFAIRNNWTLIYMLLRKIINNKLEQLSHCHYE